MYNSKFNITMETEWGSSETSVHFHQTTRRHIPQDINHYRRKIWRTFLHCFTVRMEALRSFETSENTQPTIMGDVTSKNFQPHRCKKLRSLTHSLTMFHTKSGDQSDPHHHILQYCGALYFVTYKKALTQLAEPRWLKNHTT